jgi:hypothetical protein
MKRPEAQIDFLGWWRVSVTANRCSRPEQYHVVSNVGTTSFLLYALRPNLLLAHVSLGL